MKLKVRVKHKHIRDGERGSPYNCPIAKAVGDMMPGKEVYVGGRHIHVEGVFFPLSTRAVKAISRFDKTGKMSPCTFYVNSF